MNNNKKDFRNSFMYLLHSDFIIFSYSCEHWRYFYFPQSRKQELGASNVCPSSAGQGSWAEELCLSPRHRKQLEKESPTKTPSDHVTEVLQL